MMSMLSCLEEHIASPGNATVECSASSIQDAVPATSRGLKVQALRKQCVAALGEHDFEDVYAFLM